MRCFHIAISRLSPAADSHICIYISMDLEFPVTIVYTHIAPANHYLTYVM